MQTIRDFTPPAPPSVPDRIYRKADRKRRLKLGVGRLVRAGMPRRLARAMAKAKLGYL